MQTKVNPPVGEMAWATAFIAFMGTAQLWMAWQNHSWKRAIAGAVLAGLALGIWYRNTWARRAAYVLLALAAVVQLVMMLKLDFTLGKIIWILAPLWCVWVLFRGFEDEVPDEDDDSVRHRDAVSFVALLGEPPVLDEAIVTAAVKKILGDAAAVFGSGMFWAVRLGTCVFRVSAAPRAYFANRAAKTTHADELRAVREHTAWIAVEIADPKTVDMNVAFPQMARLIAELAPENTMAIHATESGEFIGCSPGWREKFGEHQPFKTPQIAGPATPAAPPPVDTL